MADLADITTPLTAALAALTAGGVQPTGAHLWNVPRDEVVEERSWLVTVGERAIERQTGRYREAIEFHCVYAAASLVEGGLEVRDEAAAMLQAAVVYFNSPAGMTLGRADLLVSAVSPTTTGGVLELGRDNWAASELRLTVTRWILYSE